MERRPLVSVLMTAYNREKYIAQAIESVLASTFKDFELIIVDDCSRDTTVEIARHYLSDPRVKIHVNEKNLGQFPNRNHAASLAHGKYLKYVDSDDAIYPHGLEVMVRMTERFPDAGLGLASLKQDPRRIYPFQLSPNEAYQRHYFHTPLFHRAPLSAIIRSDAFKFVGGWPLHGIEGDFEMWLLLCATYPVVLMPEGVVWYRLHPEQEMEFFRRDPRVRFAYLMVSEDHLNRPECPLNERDRERALRPVRRAQARAILGSLLQCQFRHAREMFHLSKLSVPELLLAAFAK